MKAITYIKTAWCPYCAQADRFLEKLRADKPAYRDLAIEVIDEDQDPAKAGEYDYRLVPNFWVDGEKVMEGIPTQALIRQVLDQALA